VEVISNVPQENRDKATLVKTQRNKMNLLRIILGLLIPPVGVFMTVGVGPTLLINILLTVLGWLPGSIHALWVIVKHEERVASGGDPTGGGGGIY
jgi:uncharacterized membrane protein YqaE (UPF0057 family)